MTAPPDDDAPRPTPPDPLRQLLALDLPEHGTGARQQRAHARPARPAPPVSSRRSIAFAVSLAALVLAGVGLAYAGMVTVRDSTAGKTLDPTTDPDEPGFEGYVEPTPTLLVLHHDGPTLRAATAISLKPGEQGGTVVFVPIQTMAVSPTFGELPIEDGYNGFGAGAAQAGPAIADLMTIGFTEVVEVDGARWAELVAPVAPLTVNNPDDVLGVDADGEESVVFPAGELQLDAASVGRWLDLHGAGVSDLNRMVRHELFWQAWLEALAASDDPAAVPGEGDAGVGRFVRALAAGSTDEETLPVAEIDAPEGRERFVGDREAIATLVAGAVPYPLSPGPGKRIRVRVLNGTEDKGLPGEVAQVLVLAGAEIAIVGNADRFDHETTVVRYDDVAQEAAARRLSGALGVGEVELDRRPNDAVDVTVVLGRDYVEAAGG